MILYEYPLSESARVLLRLERLSNRFNELVARDTGIDHHYALMTLFEVLEVLGRSDLKADLMRDLDRHRQNLEAWRGNPEVEGQALESAIAQVGQAFTDLNAYSGKLGAPLLANDWLMALRSRSVIPGGMFEFDAPAYHAWQQSDTALRRESLLAWATSLLPVFSGVSVLVHLMRQSGRPVRAAAVQGAFQQNLPQGRTYQLLRLRLDADWGLVPEITGHRLMVAVRFMKADDEGRLRLAPQDVTFEWTLCS